MDGWMDGCTRINRGEGWLHTKDMAVHVWTGVDVEFFICLLAAYKLGGYFLFFFHLFVFFLIDVVSHYEFSSLAGHGVSLYYY
ncbi:hypothetical protein BO83DRAFT_133765 [Aspergillus eucalypticola CBS 122712]|uniref:Uncharacterized protein n=1 Tax=Aspergillus eucalypticola (strain CBS 122712 / IBT 29274) TaxID=1448314 RepID=A0A317W904_ASPEC|nr:uncharacterized protein BO83DRAFT_133765 [Aspergillus eucalypticola CBS 122712]PWY82629.1 hypothetical protein BO83DRAFT_133765 [Aspergillus eucalypticola CBS 122712]